MSIRCSDSSISSGADDLQLIREAIELVEETKVCDWSRQERLRSCCKALLERIGVEFIQREGEFSSKDQRIVETVRTSSRELDGRIAGTVSCGYRFHGRIVRQQLVVTYRFQETGDGL